MKLHPDVGPGIGVHTYETDENTSPGPLDRWWQHAPTAQRLEKARSPAWALPLGPGAHRNAPYSLTFESTYGSVSELSKPVVDHSNDELVSEAA